MGSKVNSINGVLEKIGKLDIEEQTYILEILFRRLIERRRTKIAKRATEAENVYMREEAKTGSLKDLWKDLND